MSEVKQRYRCLECGKYTTLIYFEEGGKEYPGTTYFSKCCKEDYEIVVSRQKLNEQMKQKNEESETK